MEKQSPLRAIRSHCLGCARTAQEVRLCPVTECPLFPYRFGKNPFHGRSFTEAERRAAAERLSAARAAKARQGERDHDEVEPG